MPSHYVEAEVEPTGQTMTRGWGRRRRLLMGYTVWLRPAPRPADQPQAMPWSGTFWAESDLAAEGRALQLLADANVLAAERAALRARRRVIRGAG